MILKWSFLLAYFSGTQHLGMYRDFFYIFVYVFMYCGYKCLNSPVWLNMSRIWSLEYNFSAQWLNFFHSVTSLYLLIVCETQIVWVMCSAYILL